MIRIAIASGKGGTGKTFVATNMFFTLLRNNFRAMLVDCDAEAPNDVAFFDAEPVNSTEVTQQVPVMSSNLSCCEYAIGCRALAKSLPAERLFYKVLFLIFSYSS
jgi:MinD superfamily P-loop ATPase